MPAPHEIYASQQTAESVAAADLPFDPERTSQALRPEAASGFAGSIAAKRAERRPVLYHLDLRRERLQRSVLRISLFVRIPA
jgi:hypothetical protein